METTKAEEVMKPEENTANQPILIGKDGKPCNHLGYFTGIGHSMVAAPSTNTVMCLLSVLCSNCGWLNVIPFPINLPPAPKPGVSVPIGGVARS